MPTSSFRSSSWFLGLLVAGTLGFCVPNGVQAADEDESLRALVNQIERETGGRVLSVDRRDYRGRHVERIKVLTPEGRVRVMWNGDVQSEALRNRIRPERLTAREPRVSSRPRLPGTQQGQTTLRELTASGRALELERHPHPAAATQGRPGYSGPGERQRPVRPAREEPRR